MKLCNNLDAAPRKNSGNPRELSVSAEAIMSECTLEEIMTLLVSCKMYTFALADSLSARDQANGFLT